MRGKKSYTTLTGPQLREIRIAIGFDAVSMAAVLDRMPYSTYQAYERGERSIPADVADRVTAVQERNRVFMQGLPQRVSECIDHEFPQGIPSD